VRDFLRGFGLALRRPHFAIAFWLAQAGLAAALVVPVSNFLHASLNRSPEASSMIREPSYLWWKTAERTHPDILGDFVPAVLGLVSADGSRGFSSFDGASGIGAAILGLGFLALLVHAFLLGGLFGSLHDENGVDLTVFAREGARRLPAFLIVTVGAAALTVATYHYVFVGSGTMLAGVSENLSTERQALALVGARVLALLVLLTVVKILADSIRVALVARPDLPPVTRYMVGIGSALGRLPGLVAILACYTAFVVLLGALWGRLSVKSAATTTGGVVLLVAAQQVFVLLRSFAKVGYYSGVRAALLRPGRRAPEPAGGPSGEEDNHTLLDSNGERN
jgi:hypothetical protein